MNRPAAGVLFALVLAASVCAQDAERPELYHDPSWQLSPVTPNARAYQIHSRILSEERRLFVALPLSHARTTRQYPLVLVLDGAFNFAPVATQAAVLARAGHMPEVVVAGIENTDRLRDLSPPGLPVSGNDGAGRADLFLRFLEEELRPALVHAFRAGGPVTLVGHSSGGLFAHFAAVESPAVFASILALDSPMHLHRNQPAEMVINRAARIGEGVRLVSLEAKFGWSDNQWDALTAAAPPSWTLVREAVTGETHESMVWPGSYRGLKRLFPHYAAASQNGLSPIARLQAFDAGTQQEAMPPPRLLLQAVIEDQIAARKLASAQETLVRLVAGYGESEAAGRLRARLAAAGQDSLEGPTLETLQAAPLPSADDVSALLGEWEGYTTREGAANRSFLGLSLRSQSGRPVGRFTMAQGPGHEVEYMAVVGDQVHLGYMNRMRPRGMLMYEGTVKDDVFAGQFVLRGGVFRMPDGRELPKMKFYLRRTRH